MRGVLGVFLLRLVSEGSVGCVPLEISQRGGCLGVFLLRLVSEGGVWVCPS